MASTELLEFELFRSGDSDGLGRAIVRLGAEGIMCVGHLSWLIELMPRRKGQLSVA